MYNEYYTLDNQIVVVFFVCLLCNSKELSHIGYIERKHVFYYCAQREIKHITFV
ncbi:hypothetical protein EMIT013CA1_10528 [Bacillus sp. IT-13CA1]